MRYLVAMIFAIAVAAATAVFLSGPVAAFIVGQFKFESPDQVDDLHNIAIMGTNLVGMLIGWTIGWALGGSLRPDARQD
jgi:hypothetical protein